MPKGVEHSLKPLPLIEPEIVKGPLMPKGVEHGVDVARYGADKL